MVDYLKVGTYGAIAGFVTPWMLKTIVMPVLGWAAGVVPVISAKLADPGTLNIAVTESLTANQGWNGKVSEWLASSIGMTAKIPMQDVVYAIVGGILLFIAATWAAEKLKWLTGSAQKKTMIVLFLGSVFASLLINGFALPEISLGFANTLIAMLVNAAILSMIYVFVDEQFKLNLNPF